MGKRIVDMTRDELQYAYRKGRVAWKSAMFRLQVLGDTRNEAERRILHWDAIQEQEELRSDFWGGGVLMTITENQRRTLDLMAESAGWNWSDVESVSQHMFEECVSGLSEAQARRLMTEVEFWAKVQEGDDAGA